MKNVLWFLIGVIGGFVVVYFMNKDLCGYDIFVEVDVRINGFIVIFGDVYCEQEVWFMELGDN